MKRENQRVQGLLMMDKGVVLSRQQDTGSSLIPKGDASWLLTVKAYSYETVIL